MSKGVHLWTVAREGNLINSLWIIVVHLLFEVSWNLNWNEYLNSLFTSHSLINIVFFDNEWESTIWESCETFLWNVSTDVASSLPRPFSAILDLDFSKDYLAWFSNEWFFWLSHNDCSLLTPALSISMETPETSASSMMTMTSSSPRTAAFSWLLSVIFTSTIGLVSREVVDIVCCNT